MADFDNTTWNEFQWSREMRKDELRIACYFRELLPCMDLPGEEELISRKLMNHPELVPTGVKPGEWSWKSLFGSENSSDENDGENDGGDEDEEDYPPRAQEDIELLNTADKLAVEWNAVLAGYPAEQLHAALAASCAFGKFIGRLTDLADADPESCRGFLLGLVKRALADLNEIVTALQNAAAYRRQAAGRARLIQEYLGALRGKLVDRLFAIRGEE